jgi:hypothetical protein
VSENSVGKAAVSGILCQREAELVRCGVVESSFGLKTGLELRVCKPLVLVLVQIRIQNENSS